ncbi:hypothetical protein ACIRPH_15960 [Nocardiopsis sp. NPDC101807]|uniref:hypothetical protein n=1 Tax=Nocardiopsis sp. NPDC101807 TaxID=3364339 RepID=UPI00382AACBE
MNKAERVWAATYMALAVLGGALWFGEGPTTSESPNTSKTATIISSTAAAASAEMGCTFRFRRGYTGPISLIVTSARSQLLSTADIEEQ